MIPCYFVPMAPHKLLMAVTFDDGPTPGVTDRMMAVLDKHGVKATFFMVGKLAMANLSLAREVAAAGHIIGTHGQAHKKGMKTWIRKDLYADFAVSKSFLEAEVGKVTMGRPPYGNVTPDILSVFDELGLQYVGWNMIVQDWLWMPWTDKAMRMACPGSILVLHDGHRVDAERGKKNAEHLDTVLGQLSDRGYSFVTVPQLLDEWDGSYERHIGGKRLLGTREFLIEPKRLVTPMWHPEDFLTTGLTFSVTKGGVPVTIAPISNVDDWIPLVEVLPGIPVEIDVVQ